ncbi:MAG: GxxExxY protein [Bacteroidales bacterium]|nr:GxxExxY protein [Bacteroidales bacterium]
MTENEISKIVFESYQRVLKTLGPGLLEKAYQTILAYELKKHGLIVETEVALPVIYEDVILDQAYRVDILVENKVILELKAVDKLIDVHRSQLLTYLRMSHKKLGLLINFGSPLYAENFKRVLNCDNVAELDNP